MRPALKWTGIGCGGLVGVFIALAIIGSLAGGASRPPLTPAPTEVAAPPTAAPVQAVAAPAEKPQAAPPTIAPTAVPPPPTEAPAPPPQAVEKVRVTGTGADGLNLRAEPSSTAARVKTIRDGAELEIDGPDEQAGGRTWRKVRDPSDGAQGYAAADFLAAAGAPPNAAAPPQTPDGRSPEVLLAIIQHGIDLQASDARVRPFAQQLDRLEVKCTEDRRQLADLATGANKVMADRGVTEPILNTITGIATASEGLPSEQACADVVFIGYAMTRLNGAPGATPKPQAPVQPAAKPAPSAKPSAPRAAPQGSACPATHPIKGNKSSSGEMIYHAPNGQFYSRTQPEACFATGADAQAAGYRASQR